MHVRTIINIQMVGDTANFKDPIVRKSKHKDAPTKIFFISLYHWVRFACATPDVDRQHDQRADKTHN